jgi:hypothetical protein
MYSEAELEAMAEAEAEWEMRAELAAEAAAERWFEERGQGGRDLQEDMEHSPFDPIWGM